MEKKTLGDVHISIRDLYERAVEGGNSGNFDYAIKLMKEVVKKVPALADARTKLREFEKQKTAKLGLFEKIGASWGASARKKVIAETLKTNPQHVLGLCEEELALNLNNPEVLNYMADAALKLDARFIALEALEIIRDYSPADEKNLKKLLELYRKENDLEKVEAILRYLTEKHPNDLVLHAEWRTSTLQLKNLKEQAEAAEYKRRREESKEALALQIEDGTIHDVRQARLLIEKYTRELKKKDSVDIRRKLADAYLFAGYNDEAIQELEYVARKIGALDPTLDKSIEKGYLAKFDVAIKELETNPTAYDRPEEQLQEFRRQREEYRLHRARKRRDSFPNDSQLRFDLGELYFENHFYDEAILEFSESTHSPQRKGQSLVYIGRCYLALGNYAKAAQALELGNKEMYRMDKRKLEALYYLGYALEKNNEPERAQSFYKEVHAINPNFMDVKDRIL